MPQNTRQYSNQQIKGKEGKGEKKRNDSVTEPFTGRVSATLDECRYLHSFLFSLFCFVFCFFCFKKLKVVILRPVCFTQLRKHTLRSRGKKSLKKLPCQESAHITIADNSTAINFWARRSQSSESTKHSLAIYACAVQMWEHEDLQNLSEKLQDVREKQIKEETEYDAAAAVCVCVCCVCCMCVWG